MRTRNHTLVLEGLELLLDVLPPQRPRPDHMLGSMAALPLRWPEGVAPG